MEKREYGQTTTLETRHDSHELVDKQKRYREIVECLTEIDEPMSAREISSLMCLKGYIPTDERNFVSPRLTELAEKGVVEPAGKKICKWTKRTVTAWRLCNEKE